MYTCILPSFSLPPAIPPSLHRQPRWLSGLTRSCVHSLWLLVDQCVLSNWDRILVRTVKGLISRAGMVSICPLLWQRDVKLQQTNKHPSLHPSLSPPPLPPSPPPSLPPSLLYARSIYLYTCMPHIFLIFTCRWKCHWFSPRGMQSNQSELVTRLPRYFRRRGNHLFGSAAIRWRWLYTHFWQLFVNIWSLFSRIESSSSER